MSYFEKPLTNKFLTLLLLHTLQTVTLAQSYIRDVKMGDKAAKQVEMEMGIYRHDSLERVINLIGNRLVSNLEYKPTEFQFKFLLIDSDVPNAFALPGGHVYVTRGILPIVENEDELAGILAHEIIHVVNHHSIKMVNRSLAPAILKVPGTLLDAITKTKIGTVLNLPIDIISKPLLAGYSRKHETEADELGIQLSNKAGYRPEALAEVLSRLSKGIEYLTGQKEKRSYLADHPYTPNRVKDINKILQNTTSKNNSQTLFGTRSDFLMRFQGLCYGSNPSNGTFVDSLFVHPNLNFTWTLPQNWKYINENALVAASSKNNDAFVSLNLADSKRTISEHGMEMKNKISSSGSAKIEYAGDTLIHSLPTYLLRFKSTKKGHPGTMEVMWISFNNQIFQLSGFATNENKNQTATSLRSFRTTSAADLSLVKIQQLQVIEPLNNENLTSLSSRSGNILKPELTLIYNNMKPNDQLDVNAVIKIVKMDTYSIKN